MRGTLHLAAADEVGWLLSVLGPRFKKTTRRRREQLGLDDETAARGARVLEEVLRHRGPLTRDEIRTAPDFDDVPLEGQAAPHLLGYAALDGRVCHGPKRSGAPTYVPLSEWLDLADAPPAHRARARLARHYLRALALLIPPSFRFLPKLFQGLRAAMLPSVSPSSSRETSFRESFF